MKRAIIYIFLSAFFVCAYAQLENEDISNSNKPDSVNAERTTTLAELVVTSDYAWVEGNKLIFVPRKNEKNLATDAISLIENMHIPVLYVEQGGIKSRAGGNVSIFINGIPADDMDLSTFWPKNAMRVEFMETSSDPRFAGKQNILNFIMKEYVAGGVTKLRGKQQFPNDGSYEASTKFVYKKMTYNAMFKGGYIRDHRLGSYISESYDDVWYDGNFYDRIDRIENSDDNANRSDNIYAGFNARYRTDNTILLHKVMLKWDRNPESFQNGESFYTPQLFDGNKLHSITNNRILSPAIAGNYDFILGQKWSLSASWNFNHSHTNSFSSFQEATEPEIVNKFKENSYAYGASLSLFYQAKQNMSFGLTLKEDRNIYSSYYSGYTNSHQWQHYGETFAQLMWSYRPFRKLSLNLAPQLIIKDRNTNHVFKEVQYLPGAKLNASYMLNYKNMLSFNIFYFELSPGANATNDLILRQSELTWLKGNPKIKTNDAFQLQLQHYSVPTSFFNMLSIVSWSLDRNQEMLRYFPGGKEYDGVVLQYANAGHQCTFHAQYNANFRLFSNKLSIHGDISYHYSYFTGGLHKSNAFFRPRISANWLFGNCSLSIGYAGKEKIFINGGTEIYTNPDQIYATFRYGNGNLNVDVNLTQPFRNHVVQDYWIDNGPYTSHRSKWTNGRGINISLSYTFDYGKKVDPVIDIYEESITNSSKL